MGARLVARRAWLFPILPNRSPIQAPKPPASRPPRAICPGEITHWAGADFDRTLGTNLFTGSVSCRSRPLDHWPGLPPELAATWWLWWIAAHPMPQGLRSLIADPGERGSSSQVSSGETWRIKSLRGRPLDVTMAPQA